MARRVRTERHSLNEKGSSVAHPIGLPRQAYKFPFNPIHLNDLATDFPILPHTHLEHFWWSGAVDLYVLIHKRLGGFMVVTTRFVSFCLFTVLVSAYALIAAPAPAPWQLGPTFGFQVNGLYGTQSYDPKPSNSDGLTGAYFGSFGIRYGAPICNNSMVWGGASYSMRGSSYTGTFGPSTYKSKETLNFFCVDCLIDYTLAECGNGRLYGMAGPGLNVYMSGSSTYTTTLNGQSSTSTTDIKSDGMNKLTYDGIIGIGGNYHLTSSWSLYGDLRYDLGLNTITDNTATNQVKNNAIQFGVGLEHRF